jgi:hypothetical protein
VLDWFERGAGSLPPHLSHRRMLAPRRSLSGAPVYPMLDAEFTPFDYTAPEWLEIETCINNVRGTPPISSEDDRKRLLVLADEYRGNCILRNLIPQSTTKQKRELFRKAAKLCDQLRSTLKMAAINRFLEAYRRSPALAEIKDRCDQIQTTGNFKGYYVPGSSWRSLPIMIPSDELTAAVVANLLRPSAVPEPFTIDNAARIMRAGQVFDLLNELQAALESTAEYAWAVHLTDSFSGRLDPSVVYLQQVLFLWTETFGGKLGISRSPDDSKKIGGPLVRYLLAVVRPVMGANTPSLQSLPDIVDRQKDFDHWWAAFKRLSESGPHNPNAWETYIQEIQDRHPKIAAWARRVGKSVDKATTNGEVLET